MTFSPTRTLVYFMIGLPIGFILTALGFVATGQEIAAPALVPWAAGIAAIIGIAAGFWKPQG